MALIIPYRGKTPRIADDAFVAPNAVIIGDVEIGPESNIWFGVVLRGDVGAIRIGRRSNIQDGTIVHLDPDSPAIIKDDVTIGHGAIIHGCTIEPGAQVGMGAIVLSRSTIGEGSMVAAGAVVAEDADIPSGSVAMGVPARVRRDVSEDERQALLTRAENYARRGAEYKEILEGA